MAVLVSVVALGVGFAVVVAFIAWGGWPRADE